MRRALREFLWVTFGLACTAVVTIVPFVLWLAPAVVR